MSFRFLAKKNEEAFEGAQSHDWQITSQDALSTLPHCPSERVIDQVAIP